MTQNENFDLMVKRKLDDLNAIISTKNSENEKTVKEWQEKFSEMEQKVNEYENMQKTKIGSFETKVAELEKNLANKDMLIEKINSEATQKITCLEQVKKSLETDLACITSKNKKNEEKLIDVDEKLCLTLQELTAKAQEAKDFEDQVNQLNTENDEQAQQINNLEERKTTLTLELASLKLKNEEHESNIKNLNEQIILLHQEIVDKNTKLEKVENEHNNLTEKLKTCEIQLDDAQDSLYDERQNNQQNDIYLSQKDAEIVNLRSDKINLEIKVSELEEKWKNYSSNSITSNTTNRMKSPEKSNRKISDLEKLLTKREIELEKSFYYCSVLEKEIRILRKNLRRRKQDDNQDIILLRRSKSTSILETSDDILFLENTINMSQNGKCNEGLIKSEEKIRNFYTSHSSAKKAIGKSSKKNTEMIKPNFKNSPRKRKDEKKDLKREGNFFAENFVERVENEEDEQALPRREFTAVNYCLLQDLEEFDHLELDYEIENDQTPDSQATPSHSRSRSPPKSRRSSRSLHEAQMAHNTTHESNISKNIRSEVLVPDNSNVLSSKRKIREDRNVGEDKRQKIFFENTRKEMPKTSHMNKFSREEIEDAVRKTSRRNLCSYFHSFSRTCHNGKFCKYVHDKYEFTNGLEEEILKNRKYNSSNMHPK